MTALRYVNHQTCEVFWAQVLPIAPQQVNQHNL